MRYFLNILIGVDNGHYVCVLENIIFWEVKGA